ncbi:MAG: AAA family ATPase, partial [Chloroflexota bacterium]|nr:AAA family ATPase [Chloroflexota bacterium]
MFRNLMGGPEDPNPANAGPPGPAESVNEVVDFGPEVRMGDDWFEIRGRRFPRRGPEPVTPERSFLPEQPGAGDAAAAAPARDEVFLHLTPHMVDVLERIADIDDNERLGTFVLLSGPTGCGKTTLAKTYCHISNQPLTELNFSGDTTLADFFRRTEVVTDDAGNQSTLAGLGPAARAMLLGRKLIVNEINMLPPDLISVITHAMDTGRLLLSGTEFGNIEIELHERFGIIATANPNYVGTAEMGRSLQRRFGLGLGNVPVAFLPPAEETESLLVEFARHPVMQLLGADADSGLGGRLVTLADSLRTGLDVTTWMTEGLADIVVVGGGFIPYETPVHEFVEAARGTDCRIYGCIEATRYIDERHLRGLASRWYGDGADGIYLYNFYTMAPDWNHRLFGELADPAVMA